jgi:hypothetical protein
MHSLAVLRDKIKASENGKLIMGGIVFELTQDEKSIIYTVQGNNASTFTKPITQTVNGATISGNVYGGGNRAEVTGNTYITVGREGETQTVNNPAPQQPAPIVQPAPAQPVQQQSTTPQTNGATESQQTRTIAPTRL